MKSKFSLVVLAIISLLSFQKSYAQDVSAKVKVIVGMDMDQAQEKLEGLGYKICGVKPFKRTEDWINQSEKNCITLKFDKKTKRLLRYL